MRRCAVECRLFLQGALTLGTVGAGTLQHLSFRSNYLSILQLNMCKPDQTLPWREIA